MLERRIEDSRKDALKDKYRFSIQVVESVEQEIQDGEREEEIVGKVCWGMFWEEFSGVMSGQAHKI